MREVPTAFYAGRVRVRCAACARYGTDSCADIERSAGYKRSPERRAPARKDIGVYFCPPSVTQSTRRRFAHATRRRTLMFTDAHARYSSRHAPRDIPGHIARLMLIDRDIITPDVPAHSMLTVRHAHTLFWRACLPGVTPAARDAYPRLLLDAERARQYDVL